MVCDNALLVGYALGRRPIDRAVVDEVIGDLQPARCRVRLRGRLVSPTKSPEAPPTIVASPPPVIPPAVSVRAEPAPSEPLPGRRHPLRRRRQRHRRAPAISPPSPGQRAEPYRFPSQRQARPVETPSQRGRDLRWLGERPRRSSSWASAALSPSGLSARRGNRSRGPDATIGSSARPRAEEPRPPSRPPIEEPRRGAGPGGEAATEGGSPTRATRSAPPLLPLRDPPSPPQPSRSSAHHRATGADGSRAEQAADSGARAEPVQVAKAPDSDGAKDPSSEPEPTTRATAAPARAPEARARPRRRWLESRSSRSIRVTLCPTLRHVHTEGPTIRPRYVARAQSRDPATSTASSRARRSSSPTRAPRLAFSQGDDGIAVLVPHHAPARGGPGDARRASENATIYPSSSARWSSGGGAISTVCPSGPRGGPQALEIARNLGSILRIRARDRRRRADLVKMHDSEAPLQRCRMCLGRRPCSTGKN